MLDRTKVRRLIVHGMFVAVLLLLVSSLFLDCRTHQIMHRGSIAVTGPGIGILGDSNSDEYRADDNRGGIYAATTLNWMEQLVIHRGLNFGPWGTWGEPRRSGYEYNWARSGATTASMISSGQHTGLASQVASGKVSSAFIYIGTNDFHYWNGTYDAIYNGSVAGAALQAYIDGIVANITLAVDTLQRAGNVQIEIVNILDPGISPDFQSRFPLASQRQTVTDAITKVNTGIQLLVATRGVTVIDMQGFASSILPRIDANGNINVGGELIKAYAKGDEPHNGRLGDDLGHAGTVVNGLLANLFIGPLNFGILPFTDQEILENAGILRVEPGGVHAVSTLGSGSTVQAGYATVNLYSGDTPYGTAVYSVTSNGFVVSEAGVPASPPTVQAEIFVDIRGNVPAKSDQINAGVISINTGVALVNPNAADANVTYTLRDTNGGLVAGPATGAIPAGAHRALFIDQLNTIVPDFVLPADFSTLTQFGSLEASSTQPLSILALRLTSNQRGDTLLTSTPIADLSKPASSGALYFPQVVDGGGYTTTLVLLNTSAGTETGTLQLFTDTGAPLTVNPFNGSAGSSFPYTIAPGGAFILQTDGSPASVHAGSAQVMPDPGTPTPAGAGVFRLTQNGIVVTESGIPAATPTTHARIYLDTSSGHDTGLAIAAPDSSPLNIAVNAFQTDGVTPAGSSLGPVLLNGNGHAAKFISQMISGLPAGFTGVLDIQSSSPFVALTLRSLSNGRDFLLTTFPIADFDHSAPAPIIFPQIADGGGYQTQFVLLSSGGAASTTSNFYGDDGSPLAVEKNGNDHR